MKALSQDVDDREIEARDAEEEREQRWAVFVSDVKAQSVYLFGHWPEVVRSVADAMDTRYEPQMGSFEHRCRDFAETEGWDGTLNAVARARREKGGR